MLEPERNTVRTVAITGASRGLGAALARAYAAHGMRLALSARGANDLATVASACRHAGAVVETTTFDVGDATFAEQWVRQVDTAGPIDTIIVNAGIFTGRGRDDILETPRDAIDLVRTNLEGAIHVAAAAARVMHARGRGRIALVSSLAALHPLSDAAVYSASKAGLLAYGEALREQLAPHGVGVSLVLPGHVATAQTRRQIGELPMLMSPEQAAARIKRGLDAGRGLVAFPLPMYWLVKAGRYVPWQVRAWLGRSQRFHVDKSGL